MLSYYPTRKVLDVEFWKLCLGARRNRFFQKPVGQLLNDNFQIVLSQMNELGRIMAHLIPNELYIWFMGVCKV